MREERSLRVFENRVLRRIFGPKRNEVTGEWKRLNNEELNDLYPSPNIIGVIISRIRWARHVERMGERRDVYRVVVRKPEGKRPLGRSRRRWADNVKIDLQEVGCGGMDWIDIAQDRDRWWALVNRDLLLPVVEAARLTKAPVPVCHTSVTSQKAAPSQPPPQEPQITDVARVASLSVNRFAINRHYSTPTSYVAIQITSDQLHSVANISSIY